MRPIARSSSRGPTSTISSVCGTVHGLTAHAFVALEPDEQRRVEAYLAGCRGCHEAHEQLADLSRFLDLAGGTETPIQAPLPLLEASVLHSTRLILTASPLNPGAR